MGPGAHRNLVAGDVEPAGIGEARRIVIGRAEQRRDLLSFVELVSGELVAIKVRALRPRRELYMITPKDHDGREPLRTFVQYVRDSIQ